MPSFWLEFDQNGAIQRYPFDRPSLSMGRERTCDFHLDHPTVSRQHAMIVHDPRAGFKLLVMSKSGMTAVDGAQVQGELPIFDGARLNIGQMAFTFRSQDPSAQRPAMGGGMGGGMGMGAPMGGGFGQPPAGGGFGQPPAAGGFGQPPAGGGFGQPAAAGGFGQPPGGPKPPVGNTAAQAAVGGGVASWDEIAAGAESEEEEVQRNMTDFERIEQAAAKASTKTEGTNPILLVLVVLAAVGVGYVFLMPADDSGQVNIAAADEQAPVQIKVDCLGKDDCMDKAKNSFKVGTQTLEKSDVTVSNLFESYKKFLETKQYIEKSGAPAPANMASLDDKIAQTRTELNGEFKKYRAAFLHASNYKMHGDMAKALTSIKAVFPDKTAYEYKWASEQEGQMKAKGIYPNR